MFSYVSVRHSFCPRGEWSHVTHDDLIIQGPPGHVTSLYRDPLFKNCSLQYPPPNQCWHLVAIEACIVAASKQYAFYCNSFWFKPICFYICVKRNNGFLATSDMGPHPLPHTHARTHTHTYTHTHTHTHTHTNQTQDLPLQLLASSLVICMLFVRALLPTCLLIVQLSKFYACYITIQHTRKGSNQLELSRAERACHRCTCNQFFEVQLTGETFTPGTGNQREIT